MCIMVKQNSKGLNNVYLFFPIPIINNVGLGFKDFFHGINRYNNKNLKYTIEGVSMIPVS